MSKLRESIRKMHEGWYDDDEPKWYEQGEYKDKDEGYAATYELMEIAENYIKERLKPEYEIDDQRWGKTGFIIPIFYVGEGWDGNPDHPPVSEPAGEFSFYFSRYDDKDEALYYLNQYLGDFVDGNRAFKKIRKRKP